MIKDLAMHDRKMVLASAKMDDLYQGSTGEHWGEWEVMKVVVMDVHLDVGTAWETSWTIRASLLNSKVPV